MHHSYSFFKKRCGKRYDTFTPLYCRSSEELKKSDMMAVLKVGSIEGSSEEETTDWDPEIVKFSFIC